MRGRWERAQQPPGSRLAPAHGDVGGPGHWVALSVSQTTCLGKQGSCPGLEHKAPTLP